VIKDNFPIVTLIENTSNIGFAKANNIGIRLAKSKFICLLNPDVVLLPQSITSILTFLENNSNVGICGPMLLNEDLSFQRSIIKFPTLNYEIRYHLKYHFPPFNIFFSNILNYDKIIDFQKSINYNKKVDAVPGACMFIRKKMLDQIGLLGEEYFLFSEENDLCLRAKKNNWDVYYVPSAKVIHHGGHSFDQSLQFQKMYQFYKSRYRLIQKHRNKKYIFVWKIVNLFFFNWLIFIYGVRAHLFPAKKDKALKVLVRYKMLRSIYTTRNAS
jgi:GT2 family glycosyltransferase